MKDFLNKHKFGIKWIAIAFTIKLLLFTLFAIYFKLYWPDKWNEGLFNASGDTSVYYGAVESFYNGNGYDTYCRMPGLLPIYYPIRLFLSIVATKNAIIILQFLTSVVSVYVLAKIAKTIFNSQRIFLITFFIYAFSSFVSIWDHVGYADSFGTSFLIFSIYFLLLYKNNNNWKYIMLSGAFMVWSIFFRPIHGILIPFVAIIFLFDKTNIIGFIKRGLLFVLPTIILIGLWTYRNYSKHNKIIVLQGDLSECFSGLTPDLLGIRDLIVAWGGDSQPWSKNSEGEWFFATELTNKQKEPSTDVIYTSSYTLDSLIQLQNLFKIVHTDSTAQNIKETYRNQMVASTQRYIESYKKEHFFRYYFLNKIKLLKKFLIPNRLDDLPLPGSDKMNFIQKIIKGGYFLLLIFINVFGLIGCLLSLKKKHFLGIIPLVLLITLCPVMGLIEQRYLVPIYGFFVIFTAYFFDLILQKIKSPFSKN